MEAELFKTKQNKKNVSLESANHVSKLVQPCIFITLWLQDPPAMTSPYEWAITDQATQTEHSGLLASLRGAVPSISGDHNTKDIGEQVHAWQDGFVISRVFISAFTQWVQGTRHCTPIHILMDSDELIFKRQHRLFSMWKKHSMFKIQGILFWVPYFLEGLCKR